MNISGSVGTLEASTSMLTQAIESRTAEPDALVSSFQKVMAFLVCRHGLGISTHQFAVFLTCYIGDDHTVRGLAESLSVSKSVITRALDRLGELKLLRRAEDPLDKRSIIVKRTEAGDELLGRLRQLANGMGLSVAPAGE